MIAELERTLATAGSAGCGLVLGWWAESRLAGAPFARAPRLALACALLFGAFALAFVLGAVASLAGGLAFVASACAHRAWLVCKLSGSYPG